MPRPGAFERRIAAIIAESARQHEACMASLRRPCPVRAADPAHPWPFCHDCLKGPCQRRRERGLADDGTPLPLAERPLCAARARSGQACRQHVLPGKTRCRYHGGLATGPKTAEGRARIAEAQRQRWARFRAARQGGEPGV